MRRIAIINQKGGVGKTTTATNLGAALARAGRRVVVVDMDPQANLSLYLGCEARSGEPTIYGVLVAGLALQEAMRTTSTPGLHLVPSHIDLSGAELELAATIGRETVLRDALDTWEQAGAEVTDQAGVLGPVDYLLLDCPPSLGLLSINALASAYEVLISVQTEFFALQGLGKLVEVVQLMQRRLNPRLELTGLLPNLYDNRLRLAREVLAELRRFFPGKVYRNSIRSNVKLAESPSHSLTIFEYAPESNGAKDFTGLAVEVIRQESDRVDQGLPTPPPQEPATSPELLAAAIALREAESAKEKERASQAADRRDLALEDDGQPEELPAQAAESPADPSEAEQCPVEPEASAEPPVELTEPAVGATAATSEGEASENDAGEPARDPLDSEPQYELAHPDPVLEVIFEEDEDDSAPVLEQDGGAGDLQPEEPDDSPLAASDPESEPTLSALSDLDSSPEEDLHLEPTIADPLIQLERPWAPDEPLPFGVIVPPGPNSRVEFRPAREPERVEPTALEGGHATAVIDEPPTEAEAREAECESASQGSEEPPSVQAEEALAECGLEEDFELQPETDSELLVEQEPDLEADREVTFEAEPSLEPAEKLVTEAADEASPEPASEAADQELPAEAVEPEPVPALPVYGFGHYIGEDHTRMPGPAGPRA